MSPTQTKQDAARQMSSGEIWGRAARWADEPSVKAWRGVLPNDADGVEFVTEIEPHQNPHPSLVQWRASTPGVNDRGNGLVSIRVTITKIEG